MLDFETTAPEVDNQEPTLDFFPTPEQPKLSPELAKERALKTQFALGADSPDFSKLLEQFSNNGESDLRKYVSDLEVNKNKALKQKMVEDVATNKGTNLTNQEFDFLNGFINTEPTSNPDTVLEKKFAEKYTTTAVTNNPSSNSVLEEANKKLPPEVVNKALDLHQDIVTKLNLAKNIIDDLNTKYQTEQKAGAFDPSDWKSYLPVPFTPLTLHDLSTPEARKYSLDRMEQFVPFLSTLNKYFPSDSLVPGTSVKEHIFKLWQLPPDEFQKQFKADVDRIASANTNDAISYAASVYGMSKTQEIAENLQPLVDASVVGDVGVTAFKLNKMLRDTAGVSEKAATKLEDVYTAAGDVKKAADIKGVKNFKKSLIARDPTAQGLDLSDEVPLLVNPAPTIKLDESGTLSTVAANRVAASMRAFSEKAPELLDAKRFERLPPEAIDIALQRAKQEFPIEYPDVNHRIIAMDKIPFEDSRSTAQLLSVKIGDDGGILFRTEAAANRGAEELGIPLDRYTVGKQDVHPNMRFNAEEPQTFQTSKATYKVDLKNNSTTRIKGTYSKDNPVSAKTVYVDKKDLKNFTPPEGSWRYADEDGHLVLLHRDHETPWTVTETRIPYSITPAKGLHPVELRGKGKLTGREVYSKIRFGSPITEVKTGFSNAAKVAQQGDGWYIQITKPIPETSDLYLEALQKTSNLEDPNTFKGAFLGAIRGSAETLSKKQQAMRGIAATVPTHMNVIVKELAEPIGKLSRASYNDLRAVLRHDEYFVDYETVESGKRAKSQIELETNWKDITNKLPTEKESLAYWNYYQLLDTVHLMRNLNMHRDLSKIGAEHWTLPLADGKTSKPFFGKFVKEPNYQSGPHWGMWIQEGEHGAYYAKGTKDLKLKIEQLQQEGHKVVQIPNYTQYPLKDIVGDDRMIMYVVSNRLQSKPLPYTLIDKLQAAPQRYPQKFAVVQPKMATPKDFIGDNIVLYTVKNKEAVQFAKNLETFRVLLKSKAPRTTLESFVERNLPRDLEFWTKKFNDGSLDINQPFSASKTNAPHEHQFPNDVTDHTKSTLNLVRDIDMRDIAELRQPALEGRVNVVNGKPTYELNKAEVLDPMAALRKDITQTFRNMHLDDYKDAAVNMWAAQHYNLARDPELAKNNPNYFFYNFKNEVLRRRGDTQQYRNALWARNRIGQFLHERSDWDRVTNWLEEKMFDNLPDRFTRWYTYGDRQFIKDPSVYVRNAMMDSYFGFFNFVQLPVQWQSVFHAVSIAGPRNGLPAASAAVFTRMLVDFPGAIASTVGLKLPQGYLDFFAKMISKLGYGKPEWYKEAFEFTRQYGWMDVGGEHARLSDIRGPSLRNNAFGAFRDKGRGFFREGERQGKMTSSFAAYLEWRRNNPTKVMKQADEEAINERAHTFYNHMTRAGNSAVEESYASIPLMFSTWHRRLLDQAWGKQLTGAEKTRAFIMHSMMYGIPMGVGLAVPWPIYDEVHKAILQYPQALFGYSPSDPQVRALTDGVLGVVSSWALGEDYDISKRLGPSNMTFLSDFVTKDQTLLKTFMGPQGSFMNRFAQYSFPLIAHTVSMVTDRKYPFEKADLLDMLKLVSAYNEGYKAYYMYNYHQYITNNEQALAVDAGFMDASMQVLTGSIKQKWRDGLLMIEKFRDDKKARDALVPTIVEQIQRGIRAERDGNHGAFKEGIERANFLMNVIGRFPEEDQNKTLRRAFDMDRSDLNKAIYNFYLHNGNLPAKLKQYFKIK